MSLPFVLAFHKQNAGVTHHRIYQPLRHYKGASVFFAEKITDVDAEMWEKVTHVFASRVFPVAPFDKFIELCRKSGVKLIIDNDDWWVLPPTHALRDTYVDKMRDLIVRSMKVADEVWVTNKHLASKVRKYNANIRIIPNAIDVSTWEINREPSEEVRFGYVGGNHHQLDIKESTINLQGYKSYVADVGGYPDIMNASNKISTLHPSEYHKLYSYFDVSIVPLSTSEFAKCKSHLKMLEAGFSKCALIVSHTHPYSPYITKDNCIAIKHSSEWAGAIKRLHQNPNQVADITESLYNYVQDFTMEKINELRSFE
jgi:glycosyltransferase involved in cell wall biosynthesis